MSTFTDLSIALAPIGFTVDTDHPNTLSKNNRSMGYDNDCSDDERDDDFYDRWESTFSDWANPIIAKVHIITKSMGIKVRIETSAEYGSIDIEII